MAASATQGGPRGPVARRLHALAGLSLSLILMFVALTGTLAVYSLEIDWLARPAMRVAPGPEGKRPLGDSLDAARAAWPDWRPVALQRYPGARFADQVTVVTPAREERLVWVDPYAAEVTGTGSANTVRAVLREMHRAFSSRRTVVRMAVTATCLPLALAVLTGLWMQGRRAWRGYLLRPRWGGSRRALLGDLHRLIGLWSLPVLVLVLLTTFVFLSEIVGLGPRMPPMAMASPAREAALPPGFDGAALDRAVALAEAALPGLAAVDVLLPRDGRQALALRGPSGAVAVRPTASAVSVDPATLAVVAVQDAREAGPRLRLFEAARVVHFGTVGGQATRVLWLLAGIGLVALGVLGAMIHAERMLKEAGVRGLPERGRWGHWWAGMGWGAWLGAAALAFALAMTLRRVL